MKNTMKEKEKEGRFRTAGRSSLPAAALAVMLYVVSGAGSEAFAQRAAEEDGPREPPPTRSSETLGRSVYTRVEDIMECRDNEDLACMKELLGEINEMYENDRLNTREKQVMFQFYAIVAQMEEDYPAALRWNQEILKLEELTLELRVQTLNSVAMLHYVLEDYESAIEVFEELIATAPEPDDDVYLRLAYAHYQLEQYREAIPPLLTNFELLRAQGQAIPKNSYGLLRALYLTLEEYRNAYQVVREAVVLFNDPTEWITLAQLSAQLDMFEDQAYIYWASLHGGFLDSGGEFKTLAQLLSQYENPYGCGEVMADALESGEMADEEDNLELAATCYQLAREYDMAVPFLEAAAEKYPSGENYAALGRAYFFAYDYENAAEAFAEAFDQGELEREDQTALMAAHANLNLERWDEATRMARVAMRDERSESSGRTLITIIDNERKRVENSRQKRQELAGYFRN